MRDARLLEETAKNPPDPRSPFERDRDRLLYAPQLRRLAAVTQVVGSHETHLFHNRLTHTLKVAQFGRRVAERLAAANPPFEIDPTVVESAGLAHDIGHPPFGHIAEEKLDQLLVKNGVPDGFEGNAQSMRIVARLSVRPNGTLGLNLTRATIQALTKYPWERATTGSHHRKYGAYASEHDIFAWSREGVPADQRTPEAYVMDWADDVAYALHDLEDFCIAGFIPIDRLARDEPTQSRFLNRTYERWSEQGRVDSAEERTEIERVANVLFSEFPTELNDMAVIAQLGSSKANLFASGLAVEGDRITEDPDMRRQLDLLKSLTWTYVIESPGLAAQQTGQRRIVENLFEYFVDATAHAQHSLPEWASTLAREADAAGRHRIACDIVASLTETQAVALHARISGLRIGSIHEHIGA